MARKTPSKKAPVDTVGAEVTKPEVTQAVETKDMPGKVRFACPDHGDITNSTLHLTFSGPDGKNQGQFLYCLHCLNDVLLSLQKGGAIKTVQIVVPDELAKQMAADKAAKGEEATPPDASEILQNLKKVEVEPVKTEEA